MRLGMICGQDGGGAPRERGRVPFVRVTDGVQLAARPHNPSRSCSVTRMQQPVATWESASVWSSAPNQQARTLNHHRGAAFCHLYRRLQ